MLNWQRILNALFIFVLGGVLVSGYCYQFIKSEDPCPLCMLQRLGMLGIATALLLNLRFGIKVEHYGLAILSALLGRIVSLRQISLHVCPDFPRFGEPILGYDLYVWAFIVFTASIFAIAILLMMHGFSKPAQAHYTWGFLEKAAFVVVALLAFGNTITTLMECGLSACTG